MQMDARGWIPISLIATFNRVVNLTTDVQLVTEVLALSSMVEVRSGHVRMLQWQQFVLPTAAQSQIEGEPQNPDGEDEDEEDVVFVL